MSKENFMKIKKRNSFSIVLIAKLLMIFSINASENPLLNSLWVAVQNNDTDEVARILNENTAIKVRTLEIDEIEEAIKNKNSEIVKILLEHEIAKKDLMGKGWPELTWSKYLNMAAQRYADPDVLQAIINVGVQSEQLKQGGPHFDSLVEEARIISDFVREPLRNYLINIENLSCPRSRKVTYGT